MPKVLIAGATGYLGRFLCAAYRGRGYHVTALVRDRARAGDLEADTLIEAEATRPKTLSGVMEGVDLVVSALGITRQADGLSYRDVDFGANLNLLREAERAGVGRFAYVHVLKAQAMRHVPLVAAKADFVDALQASQVASTGRGWLDVGGPETFTQAEIAQLAFAALDRPARITRLPDALRKAAFAVLPWVTPRRIHGPAQFFLTALALDMVGEARGTHRLSEHFRSLAGGTGSTLSQEVTP